MSIWDWALETYARDGVPQACLDLQDAHGQNTVLLLWAVWAETDDPDLLARAVAAIRAWDEAAVKPLRAVRRGLKAPVPQIEDDTREALRDEVKAVELRAERILMETLDRMAGRKRGGVPALTALRAASAAWGDPAPDDALAVLAEALH